MEKVMLNSPKNIPLVEIEMDFDTLSSRRKCREAKATEKAVRTFCEEKHIPFFMRSKPAIEYLRLLH
jgi:hypothetical protein